MDLPTVTIESQLPATESLNKPRHNPKYLQTFLNLGIGIWDGNDLLDVGKLLMNNLKSSAITLAEVAEFLLKLKVNYAQRESEAPFRNITDYLTYGKLTEYVATSTLQYLTEHNVGNEVLKYFIEPLMIHIYDQELDMNSFAAFASLTSLLSSGKITMTNEPPV